MENEFLKVIVNSTMGKPSYLSGHTQEIQRPCTIYALYSEKSGTILLESIWCDGVTYPTASFADDELNKFYNEVKEHLIAAF